MGIQAGRQTTVTPLWNSYYIKVLKPIVLICYDSRRGVKYKPHSKDESWLSRLWIGKEFPGNYSRLTCNLAGHRGMDNMTS